jgi:hypothetical protein
MNNHIQEPNVLNEPWFEELRSNINHIISSDQLQISTGTASEEKVEFYNNIKEKNFYELSVNLKQEITSRLVQDVILDYVHLLGPFMKDVRVLAFDYNDSTVFVWAEINEDDDETEDNLFRIESQVNAKHGKTGFTISSTIVEESDNLCVPNHYRPVFQA